MKMAEELHSPSILTTPAATGPAAAEGAGWVYRTRSAPPLLTAGRFGRYREGVAKHHQHLWAFASLVMAGQLPFN